MTPNELIYALAQLSATTVTNVAGLWFLVWYRVNRKFKREKNTTWGQRFEAYWVEIVITVVVVPQWPDTIRAIIELLTNGR